jgi:hypothetical protein
MKSFLLSAGRTLLLLACLCPVGAAPSESGTISGMVTIAGTRYGAQHATLLLIPLGVTTLTDDSGHYSFHGLLPGMYEVVAHMHALTDERKT